jgi:hypothetical protein
VSRSLSEGRTFQFSTMPVAASTSVTASASQPNAIKQIASVMVAPAGLRPS